MVVRRKMSRGCRGPAPWRVERCLLVTLTACPPKPGYWLSQSFLPHVVFRFSDMGSKSQVCLLPTASQSPVQPFWCLQETGARSHSLMRADILLTRLCHDAPQGNELKEPHQRFNITSESRVPEQTQLQLQRTEVMSQVNIQINQQLPSLSTVIK